METKYCTNCNKNVGVKRHVGLGTIFGIFLTGFLWVLAIPFYPKVCQICKSEKFLTGKKENSIRRTVSIHTCPTCDGTGEVER